MKNFDEFSSEILTEEQIKFLYSHVNGTWNIEEDGLVNVKGNVYITLREIVKFPVKFGTVSQSFDCQQCDNLETLEGAPHTVGENFVCNLCSNLKSLVGGPKKVGQHYYCTSCTSITSLEGVPSHIGRGFNCIGCKNLKNLVGGPKYVGGNYYCSLCEGLTDLEGCAKKVGKTLSCNGCENLKSLKGAPESVGEGFFCRRCTNLETLEGAQYVKGIQLNFDANFCTSLPKYQQKMASDKDKTVLLKWLESDTPIEEWAHKNRGLISSRNVFG